MATIKSKEEQIADYRAMINDPLTSSSDKAFLQTQIDRLEAGGGGASGKDAAFVTLEQLMFRLNQLMLMDSGVNKTEVRKILLETLKTDKISASMLSPEVMAMLSSGGGKIEILVNIAGKVSKGEASGMRRLYYLIMSDVEAGNNVYLYGGAGTGKTYIASQVADSLNYKLLTINCSQYTSPMEIKGGQSIDGYQEGTMIKAWANLDLGINDKTGLPYEGAVLLLDELPKLDPNTAGLLNEALSKMKDPKKKLADGKLLGPKVMNGQGQSFELKNLFVIGTGNTPLNRADPDYEANFKQDLSLQDRFAGSCYEVFVDYEFELNNIMRVELNGELWDFTWLWNLMIKLRNAIVELNYTKQAFVSTRTMTNMRDTYIAFRKNMTEKGDRKNDQPKTLQDGLRSFLMLFTEDQRTNLRTQKDIKLEEFSEIVDRKNAVPVKEMSNENDLNEAKALIENWKKDHKDDL